MSFAHICEVRVPGWVIEETMEHLREMGTRRMEGFSLWAGRARAEIFQVTHNIIPDQYGRVTKEGVCVVVGPDALHRLNVWLYENEAELIAQIHSHPREAYHSDTDDTFAIVTTHGGFSLVVPNFARDSFKFSQCAIYRLNADALWEVVPPKQVAQVFRIE